LKIEDWKAPERGLGLSSIDRSAISQSPISWLEAGSSILLARGGDAVVRFLLFLATAAILSPADFSVYALLTAALATCQWTLSFGAPRQALYFGSRGLRGVLETWLYTLGLGAGAMVFLGVLLVPGLRETFFPGLPLSWVLLGLAPLPFSLLSDSLAALLIASGRTRAYGATLWMRNAGTALVLLSGLAASNRLLWILAGRFVVQAAVAIVTALLARARPRSEGLARFVPQALRYGVPTALSDAVVAIHRRADVFLLAAFGRAPEIGAYALAYALAEAVWLVTDSLEAALFVDITRRSEQEARRAVKRAARLCLLIAPAALLAGLGVGMLVWKLLFAVRYPAAGALLPWSIGAAVIWGVSKPFASYFASRERLRLLVGCQAAGLAVNLALNLVLIPALGARGAAIASFASYAVDSLALWLMFLKVQGSTYKVQS
jgi:O-antigen/teichoic acid export membrane protein